MAKDKTRETTGETVEPTFDNTSLNYSYAPLVELAVKLAGRIKAAKNRRNGLAPPQIIASAGLPPMAEPEQAQTAKPVASRQL